MAFSGVGLCFPGCSLFVPKDQPLPVVFFAGDDATLDVVGQTVVANAAQLAKRYPLQPVRVVGFTSPAGVPAANRALAEARARAVADALIMAGVSSDRVRFESGGTAPYADTPTQSRRVEIRIGI
ncbi:OmpA family protein [Paracraurococcus sp. LOR1-02]|uniref:OmpA family protein n=2 Tax=Paracraurococcus lichenis TaxID=3064888 RepID=A0ABT9EDR9_9PROT|nr:OmpA family protein [Paracraurococcus sp. LOR1-02]MDO9714363.1 OmpA family protein [Paracraurococcus sp. LOR1-02]